jgi:DNA polymerase III alpha subunit
VASYEQQFVRGAVERGLDEPTAKKVWEQIASFAGYAFCKAHSASYAQESYQSTYLKAHYPAAFMAAVLANGGGFYHAEVYVNEARRMGLKVLPPDVNESLLGWSGWDDWIRAGLEEVRGLTAGAAEAIVGGRRDGPYRSVEDLLSRVSITQSEVENLVRAGAFDSFGRTRPQLLWEKEGQSPIFHETGNSHSNEARRKIGDCPSFSDAPDLFYGHGAVGVASAAPDGLCDYTIDEKVRDEMRLLGYSVTAHPMSLYQGRLRRMRLVRIRDIERYAGRRVKVCGWFVTARRTTTERGRQMRFLSVEDMTGVLETVLFPDAYARYGHLLTTPGPYLLTGTVHDDHTHCTLTVDKVEVVEKVEVLER